MEEKDLKMSVREFATMIIATILIFVFVGAGIGYVITYNQMKDDCPDCELICPDVIDYGENYTAILNEILETIGDLNISVDAEFDVQAILDAIRNSEDNITYDISWLEWKVDWMDYYVCKIRNDTLNINLGQIPQYPRDYIMIVNYTENVSLQIEYYDNLLGYNLTSPTFTIQNWTEFMDWFGSIGDARIYPNQRLMIMLIGINMAYYKETGTWLGE